MKNVKVSDLITKKVTIYFVGEMMGNVHRIKARAFYYQTGSYAQYPAAVEAVFIGKGKRTPRGIVQTAYPSLLIVEGWDNPEPDGIWAEEKVTGDGVTTARGRYSSCDEGWRRDFDAKINPLIASGAIKVIADFRKHNSHDASLCGKTAAEAA